MIYTSKTEKTTKIILCAIVVFLAILLITTFIILSNGALNNKTNNQAFNIIFLFEDNTTIEYFWQTDYDNNFVLRLCNCPFVDVKPDKIYLNNISYKITAIGGTKLFRLFNRQSYTFNQVNFDNYMDIKLYNNIVIKLQKIN